MKKVSKFIDISKLSDNYIVAIFFLIITKLIAFLLKIYLNFFLNYILLIVFLIISYKLNLIRIIKGNLIIILEKNLPEFVSRDDIQDLDPYAIEKIELRDKKKEKFHSLIINIIFLRLLIEQELYLFIILNFIFLQLLIFNKLIILASIYKTFILISKLILYIMDFNMEQLKSNLLEEDESLKDKEIAIKATKHNSIMLSYWIMRWTSDYIFSEEMYRRKRNYAPDYLTSKIEEQFIYEVPNKFIKNTNKFDKVEKNKRYKKIKKIFKREFHTTKSLSFPEVKEKEVKTICYISFEKLKKIIIEEKYYEKLILKKMKNHPCIIVYG